MGKNATGEKQKFDLIAASKTKKYKIIMGVVLGLGLLLLGVALILQMAVTSAVSPNGLNIDEKLSSNLRYLGGNAYEWEISQDEVFFLSTNTSRNRALATPITFTLTGDAKEFVQPIAKAYYTDHYFEIKIKPDAPAYITDQEGNQHTPRGTLLIECGNFQPIVIQLIYTAVPN